MTISKELFLAILSMDAYNRGYGSKISDGLGEADADGNDTDGLGRVGSHVGSATVILDANQPSDQTASFYAIAYELTAPVGDGADILPKDTTVISYRGTDQILPSWGETWGDLLQGWTLGAGYPDKGSQGNLSLAFYAAVTGQSAEQIFDAETTGNTVVTGHSLGGGLARCALIERIAA
jgi:hypothetical protein